MHLRSNLIVAVIGAGAMGSGIAQVAAVAGHRVVVIDQDSAALARGRLLLVDGLLGLIKRGKLSADAAEEMQAAVEWSTDFQTVAPAGLVIEAIVERAEIKEALFDKLGAWLAPDTILATNTSSLAVADLARASPRPEHFLGLHFFNPAPAMKLVEVVAGPLTAPAVTQATFDLMRRWGKHPVLARDVPGFIVNRVARPYYAEGFAALEEGLAPGDIDRALTGSGGFRMGPLALADLIGHDVNYAVACSIHAAYEGRTRFRPQPAQARLVEAGTLGRKSGRGVFEYSDNAQFESSTPPLGLLPTTLNVAAEAGEIASLVELAQRAGLHVAVDKDLPPATIAVDGTRMAAGDGRRLASRAGLSVLLDPPRDWAASPVLAFTAADTVSAKVASGLARALGKSPLRIPDRPGQIVLRTLAQLANAAADAVNDEVADDHGVDDAMIHGAGHPQGPLAWARGYGFERVGAVLAHLANETGDALYAPSPLFSPSSETHHD